MTSKDLFKKQIEFALNNYKPTGIPGRLTKNFSDFIYSSFMNPSSDYTANDTATPGGNLGYKLKVARDNRNARWDLAQAIDPTYNTSRVEKLDNLIGENAYWNDLDESQKLALMSLYETEYKDADNLYGLLPGKQYALDTDALLADLKDLSQIKPFDLEAPNYAEIEREVANTLNPYYADARNRALDTYNYTTQILDDNLQLTRQMYEDQFRDMSELYNRSVSNMLSNQYTTNAQTYDALQSDLKKSRQNALEAGASAGVRIAGNVNALLSAQNKQSQTAMDTSNALAEMLLQQRNAASGLRSDYNQYMSNYKLGKANAKSTYDSALTSIDTDYRNELSDRTDKQYDREMSDYRTAETNYSNQFTDMYNQGNAMTPAYETYLRKQKKYNK